MNFLERVKFITALVLVLLVISITINKRINLEKGSSYDYSRLNKQIDVD